MSKKILVLLCVLFQGALQSANTEYVNITENPHHVSIQKNGRHACSGALVDESWVITVASCVFGVEMSTVSVLVRTSTLSSGDKLRVGEIVVHEDFDKYVLLNDIALIKACGTVIFDRITATGETNAKEEFLKVPVQFGEQLLPIGLPQRNYEIEDGAMCSVTGWTYIEDEDEVLVALGVPESLVPIAANCQFESQLSAITVPVVNQETCKSKMPCYQPMFQKMVCAGNMTQGVETCQGDRGAPLTEGATLIGVLSYGLGCKTKIHPGIFTRISSYLTWIQQNSGVRF